MSRLFFSLSSSYCLFSFFISPKSDHCLPLSLAFEADGDEYIMMKCMPITFLFIPSWAPEAQIERPIRPCRQYAGFGLGDDDDDDDDDDNDDVDKQVW